ncbi:hypothetical protein FA95DRAFT_1559776 [Auriscalpium vulgare]|uniref:Uncharacterized protein n=1 Tax=Auriscalpium vulgare TaxID=40419 RepID=A0ACB8RRM7_9AGAM|nr:hypothetical protein FA95DRAFT_1559776 [Auriscalpium vulgare]
MPTSYKHKNKLLVQQLETKRTPTLYTPSLISASAFYGRSPCDHLLSTLRLRRDPRENGNVYGGEHRVRGRARGRRTRLPPIGRQAPGNKHGSVFRRLPHAVSPIVVRERGCRHSLPPPRLYGMCPGCRLRQQRKAGRFEHLHQCARGPRHPQPAHLRSARPKRASLGAEWILSACGVLWPLRSAHPRSS